MTEDVSAEIDRLLASRDRWGRGHAAVWVDRTDPRCKEAVELVEEVLALGRRFVITQPEISKLLGLRGKTTIMRVKAGRIQCRELEPLIARAEEVKAALERRVANFERRLAEYN